MRGFVDTLLGEPRSAAGYRVAMRIEPVQPVQQDHLGDLTVAADRGLPGRATSDRYAGMLRDVASRVREAEVLVAIDDDGALLGGVTYVGEPASSLLTTANMEPAHRLYERLGFRRRPESDMIVEDGLHLRSYVPDLRRERDHT